jgi:hypothetical protein
MVGVGYPALPHVLPGLSWYDSLLPKTCGDTRGQQTRACGFSLRTSLGESQKVIGTSDQRG